jgi:hypothetical protein
MRRRLAAVLFAAAAAAACTRSPHEPAAPEDANARLRTLAAHSAPGLHPRYLHGEASYWTVVGVAGDEHEALLDADGMLEVAKGAFSLEPFLHTGSAVLGWREARTAQALDGGYLPIPEVVREHGALRLRVRAFAGGPPGAAQVYASYRVENRSAAPASGELRLALRPLQVLPPWQFLNMAAGFAPIGRIRFADGAVEIDGEPRVFPLDPPDAFHAARVREGAAEALLASASPGGSEEASDPDGFAMGVLRWRYALAPGEAREVHLRIPFPGSPRQPRGPAGAAASTDAGAREVDDALEATRASWRATLGRIGVRLPSAARAYEDTLRTAVAHILIHQDGPRIQPGSRNYERSWIRDGALTSSALLQMGFADESAAFLRWYAGHQREDGAIPCCIDARGADFTPEHDAPGEFIYAVAEDWRITRNTALLRELWPHVVRTVGYLEALRAQRMTDAYRTPERRLFFGLLPESISHEGYAKKAMHSYWDDLWALRGLRDAALLAKAVGDAVRTAEYAALAAAFHRDLVASYEASMARHGIDYLPGAAELGDFDPTATAVALTTGIPPNDLPQPALANTFEHYLRELRERLAGALTREAYAPYELRIADALVRLGRRDDADALLGLVLADRRPLAWNQWPEILWADPARADFLGDLPHGWIGSTYVHALRAALVFERSSDASLVLAAGVPAAWLADGEPLRVTALPTYYGPLDYELHREAPDRLRLRVAGALRLPPGGLVLAPPLHARLRRIEVNGHARRPDAPDSLVLRSLPADVVLWE